MDFVTNLPISINWKRDNYDSILVIVNRFTKMVHYKPVKITTNAFKLTKIIINIVVRHHSLLHSIVTDWDFLFTSKFWSWLCYFLGIKRQLSTTFHLQLTTKPKGRTVPRKSIPKVLSILSRMIEPGSYQWPSLLITMPKTRALTICLSSWIVAIILAFSLRKTPIFAPDQNLLTSYQQSYKSL